MSSRSRTSFHIILWSDLSLTQLLAAAVLRQVLSRQRRAEYWFVGYGAGGALTEFVRRKLHERHKDALLLNWNGVGIGLTPWEEPLAELRELASRALPNAEEERSIIGVREVSEDLLTLDVEERLGDFRTWCKAGSDVEIEPDERRREGVEFMDFLEQKFGIAL